MRHGRSPDHFRSVRSGPQSNSIDVLPVQTRKRRLPSRGSELSRTSWLAREACKCWRRRDAERGGIEDKRKREDKKPKVISKEEEAALKAREAARKRVEDREKPLMGLYRTY